MTATRDHGERALAQQLERGVSGDGGSNKASVAGTGDRGLELTAGEDTYIQQGVESVVVKAR
jgi:hypothetical protein